MTVTAALAAPSTRLRGVSLISSSAVSVAPRNDSVTVIEHKELRTMQFESVSQAIRFVPGFGVVQQGGRGALTSLFPRGGESDYTLVIQDGIPLNAFGGGFDAAHLAAGQVDRVEVVRGPQSALYGGGAIGGILQVVTPRAGPLRATALVEFGGYGTTATSLGAACELSSACVMVIAVMTGSVTSMSRSSRCIAASRTAASPDVRAITVVGNASDWVYDV